MLIIYVPPQLLLILPALLPAAALTSDRPDAAAAQLARAAADVGTASAAAALAAAAGSTQALVEAAVRAVRQGASAEALAQALAAASGGGVDPALLRLGDAAALATVVDRNVRDSVEVVVRTNARSLSAASNATASALAVVEDVCRGGNATAAAAAAAKATASATGGLAGMHAGCTWSWPVCGACRRRVRYQSLAPAARRIACPPVLQPLPLQRLR